MEIEYLTKMKNNPKVGKFEMEGVSEEKIEKLEKEFNIKLPKAYKEFLFLGGNYSGFGGDWISDYQCLDWVQANIKESMDSVNLQLKPHFIFGEYNNNQALFFFLDEGENPPIYAYYEDKIEENGKEVFYKKTDNSFSDCIDGFIDFTLKGK